MANTVTNPGARLAGLTADLMMKIKNGSISEDELALFCKRQNPFLEVWEAQGFMTVSHGLTFAERISRGNYNMFNSDLTENRFPITADQYGEWEWKLFHFKRRIFSEEVILLMKDAGFEPAKICHILTFGMNYPEEQRKYPIIGLGQISSIDLVRRVSGLSNEGDTRRLYINSFTGSWHGHYRFLGVRRRQSA